MKKLFIVSSLSIVMLGATLVHAKSLGTVSASSQDSVSHQQRRYLNLNQATIQQLVALKGLGKKRARSIISYREAHGRFNSVADLVKVKGIGAALLKKIHKKNPVQFRLK